MAITTANQSIKLCVHMEPVAKARARVGKFGAYTPTKTVAAEGMIRMAFMASKQKKIEGKVPLRLDATFYMKRPKSVKKDVIWHIKRPDKDNLEKLVKDALNNYAYDDDSQICAGEVQKQYDDVPRIEIFIKEIDETETLLWGLSTIKA